MEKLTKAYSDIWERISAVNEKITWTEKEIQNKSENSLQDAALRIARLEKQIEKIDDYVLKIRGFQELAKKNLDSQNVLTIEAPPGYRVNLNRLRNWAMMIDPTSSNDPYAQRVYLVAKCDECFLEKKREEFSRRIAQLKEQQNTGNSTEVDGLKASLATLYDELKQIAASDDIAEFAELVVEENDRFWYKTSPKTFNSKDLASRVISPGACAKPLPFEKEQKVLLKSAMGDYYDLDAGRVLLPIELDNRQNYVMMITCAPSQRKKLDRALQNFVLATINEAPAGARKVYVLDGVRYNSSSMGSLRQLEGSYAMEQIPRNPEQLTAALEQIVSSFSDVDETIELYDSVVEYNASVDADKRLPLTTIIFYGWPTSFTGQDKELIQRIMTNYERYGISFITVRYKNVDKIDDAESKIMPEYALQNALHISMLQNRTMANYADESPQHFVWYTFSGELESSYIDSLLKNKTIRHTIGNEYGKRYPLTELPHYTREYKKIELPFGIDGKDEVHSVSFENENFATYLVGASRSGKSTLLHTLIAGLIRNYHPDNVELWLADFKQLEFKKYIEHCPPHVKYILLDESPELVYDLIDKLTEKMLERQQLFAHLGKERIDQIDVTKLSEPLPVIFVILDEFSIMSQSIAQSDSYRIRLQNLLAKGAALGIKFLFSSQTFTTGIAGLTPTARAQIQQRIAMKGTKEEISETLELSANLKTEQVVNWMEALPPHYALIKHRTGADTLPEVNRFLVMYIPDYSLRDRMIDEINGKMKAGEGYRPNEIDCYKDKKSVIVDGNSYESFESRRSYFGAWIERAKSNQNFTGDELFLNLGTPRRMEVMAPIVLAPESRENVMLIADSSEMACSGAIVCSAIRSFLMQGGKVSIWAYGRNRLFRTYKTVWDGFDVAVDIDAVCNNIREMKQKIESKTDGKELIVWFGMERICSDFELLPESNRSVTTSSASTFNMNDLLKSGALVEREEGEPDLAAFLKSVSGASAKADTQVPPVAAPHRDGASTTAETVKPEDKKPFEGAYNAKEDLAYILRQGSRFGYHILTVANSLADFAQSGMKPDLFRHRMAFSVTRDDSWEIFKSGLATGMPEHICRYSDTLNTFSFRPYLHREFGWDGWFVNGDGNTETM